MGLDPEQRHRVSAWVSTGPFVFQCCSHTWLHHAPQPISLTFGSIHSSTASNTCAQGRTGIHSHHKHTQKCVGHWQQTQQCFNTTNSLRNMFLFKKWIPNGKGTSSTLMVSHAPSKKKVPLINSRTKRFAFEGCTINAQQVLLHLPHKSKSQMILEVSPGKSNLAY